MAASRARRYGDKLMSEGRNELEKAIEVWERRHVAAVQAKNEAEVVMPFLRAAIQDLDRSQAVPKTIAGTAVASPPPAAALHDGRRRGACPACCFVRRPGRRRWDSGTGRSGRRLADLSARFPAQRGDEGKARRQKAASPLGVAQRQSAAAGLVRAGEVGRLCGN